MTMTDKERFEYAEKIMACRNEDGTINEATLKELAESSDVESDDDRAAILNIVQDLLNHDAAQTEEVTEAVPSQEAPQESQASQEN